MSMSIEQVVRSIDWTLLREQKEWLMNVLQPNSSDQDMVDGILQLFDSIQDVAVSDGLASAVEVFGEDEDCKCVVGPEWSGSPNPKDPDNSWVCDDCGRVIPAEGEKK